MNDNRDGYLSAGDKEDPMEGKLLHIVQFKHPTANYLYFESEDTDFRGPSKLVIKMWVPKKEFPRGYMPESLAVVIQEDKTPPAEQPYLCPVPAPSESGKYDMEGNYHPAPGEVVDDDIPF